MNYRHQIGLAFLVILFFVFGCSGRSELCSPELNPPESEAESFNHMLAGMWLAEFDLDSLAVTITENRTSGLHYNITWMLPSPQIHVNSYDPVENVINVDVTIRNPYSIGGYDVRLIIYTDDIGHMLINSANWTGLYDIPGGMDINPFIACAADNPNRRFLPYSSETVNLLIKLPGGDTHVSFALDASYPNNCVEPYEITDFAIGEEPIPSIGDVDVSCSVKTRNSVINDVVLEIREPGYPLPLFETTLENSEGDFFEGTINLQNSIPSGTYEIRIKASSLSNPDLYIWYARPVEIEQVSDEKRIVGYFVGWGVYARNYHVKNIHTSDSAECLTHINYAFANISSTSYLPELGDWYADVDKFYDASMSVDGVSDDWTPGLLRGNFNQLRKLKQMYPDLKIMISIGGWTWSYNFPEVASTPARREAFADACIDMFIEGNFTDELTQPGIFDGIDIDWEYPGPGDTDNFTSLLAEIRQKLDDQEVLDGREYLLTIAAPAGEANYWNIDFPAITPHLDFINAMTYDYHGGWDSSTNLHSPLYGDPVDPTYSYNFWTDYTIQDCLSYGVPPEKLNAGVPFYGRGWKGVNPGPMGNGLYQTASGPADGTYEAGIEDYKVLKNLEGIYNSYFHPVAQSFYLYDPSDGVFWSYDNPMSMANKAQYAVDNSLGGVMFWELSGDDETGTLIHTIRDNL